MVDPTADADSRNFSRGFSEAPPPDFTLDVAAIESVKGWSDSNSALPVSLSLPRIQAPRPQDVGILAIEPYVVTVSLHRYRYQLQRSFQIHPGDSDSDIISIATSSKYILSLPVQ